MKNDHQLLVVKFGTTSVCEPESLKIREDWIQSVASDIKLRLLEGTKVVIFTSGGLATGRRRLAKFDPGLPLPDHPKLLGAIGLNELLYTWQKNFDRVGLSTAPLSIREEDLDSTDICDLIKEMTTRNIIPIINENIPLQNHFNNDSLAAMICKKIGATRFILFTDTDGVYTDNPKTNPKAVQLEELSIEKLDIGLEDTADSLGSDGMRAKLSSAIKVKEQGIDTLIANGTALYPISRLTSRKGFTRLVD